MNSRPLFFVVLWCLFASTALAQDAAPAKQDPAVVRKYLAMRAEIAEQKEKEWRDDFENTGLLPDEYESDDTPAAPTLGSPAKEHLGVSDPKTLIPELQKELTRLVKLASSREADREEKRESKKQATKIRVSLRYFKRNKEEFQKAYDQRQRVRKENLEKQIFELRTDSLTYYFSITTRSNNASLAFAVGRFGSFRSVFSGDTNIHIQQVLSDSSALVSYRLPRNGRVRFRSPLFRLEGMPTSKWANDTSIKLPGFFYVSGTTTYNTVNGGTNTVFVVKPFDAGAAMKSAEK